jgi:DNA-binding MarR family transcriptional regulator
MSRKPGKAEYEILASFRYALRQFLRFSEESARSCGLEPQQHQALLSVKGYPGRDRITIGELAERLQVRHHSAVGLVNRLVRNQLLIREVAPVDHRQVFIMLTPRGDALLEQLSESHKQELRRLIPQLAELLRLIAGMQVAGPKKGTRKTLTRTGKLST